ncbi:cysteine--tRNA ligase [Candidatus Woesearchaeota archaeon]|nr:cysteine--tRNA ligase [Candidatus Woesearchaeota archaeon]
MLKLYNTLTKKKEIFKPMKDKKVNLFICGLTVYDYVHIGHAKTYIQFDFLVKYLRWKGFKVFYLQNVTDIDDRIIKKANDTKQNWKSLALKFEKEYLEDTKNLDIDSINKYARATDFIPQIIDQVNRLVKKGYAYETEDGIYFEVKKFKEYGKLSGQDLNKIIAGSRIDINEKKKNSEDFVLWKKQKPNEPFWESPFGNGRPGWHIEDTAITEHFFGSQYDLHGGAIDLIFPHHECEIAQQEAASGKKPFVKYWVHTAFLNMGSEKMSKSLGNIIRIKDVLKKYDLKVIRYLFISQHYRTTLTYSEELLEQAKNSLQRLQETIYFLKKGKDNKKSLLLIKKARIKIERALDNDLDTPIAFSVLFELSKNLNKIGGGRKSLEFFKEINHFLGIFDFGEANIPKEIIKIAEKRLKARSQKNWQESDKLREKLKKKGYLIEDIEDTYSIKQIS